MNGLITKTNSTYVVMICTCIWNWNKKGVTYGGIAVADSKGFSDVGIPLFT